jgi:hypothetical protein
LGELDGDFREMASKNETFIVECSSGSLYKLLGRKCKKITSFNKIHAKAFDKKDEKT